jgi:hypothetical protein
VGQLWARHPARLGAQWAGTLAQSQLQKTCRGAA